MSSYDRWKRDRLIRTLNLTDQHTSAFIKFYDMIEVSKSFVTKIARITKLPRGAFTLDVTSSVIDFGLEEYEDNLLSKSKIKSFYKVEESKLIEMIMCLAALRPKEYYRCYANSIILVKITDKVYRINGAIRDIAGSYDSSERIIDDLFR